jgi:Zinc-finger associated domain (zf-AD)
MTARQSNRTVAEMIFHISGIKVTQDDELPQSVCSGCFKSLESACELKDLCIESYKYFTLQFDKEVFKNDVTVTQSQWQSRYLIEEVEDVEEIEYEVVEDRKIETDHDDYTIKMEDKTVTDRYVFFIEIFLVKILKFSKKNFFLFTFFSIESFLKILQK